MNRIGQHGTYQYNEIIHQGHPFFQRQYPQALWQGDPKRPEFALTFDDGPSKKDLHEILTILDRFAATATFFFIGEKVAQSAALVREVGAAGHAIGIHGYRHMPFPQIKASLLRAELRLTQTLIARLCGWPLERVRDVRPPFGIFTPTTLTLLQQWGYRPVMWSLVPFHWRIAEKQSIGQIQRRLTNGSLLILHEDMVDGPSVVDLLVKTLQQAQSSGLQPITIEQMWSQREPHMAAS